MEHVIFVTVLRNEYDVRYLRYAYYDGGAIVNEKCHETKESLDHLKHILHQFDTLYTYATRYKKDIIYPEKAATHLRIMQIYVDVYGNRGAYNAVTSDTSIKGGYFSRSWVLQMDDSIYTIYELPFTPITYTSFMEDIQRRIKDERDMTYMCIMVVIFVILAFVLEFMK